MAKIAVITTGGKQYLVKKGTVLKIEKLIAEVGAKIDFPALLLSEEDGKSLSVGAPLLESKISAKIIEQGRADKVRVVHYKAKTRRHKVYGHRQPFTKIEITEIA
jgi:large subunit ribosomal protein L21